MARGPCARSAVERPEQSHFQEPGHCQRKRNLVSSEKLSFKILASGSPHSLKGNNRVSCLFPVHLPERSLHTLIKTFTVRIVCLAPDNPIW
jgi:hypothetical protein